MGGSACLHGDEITPQAALLGGRWVGRLGGLPDKRLHGLRVVHQGKDALAGRLGRHLYSIAGVTYWFAGVGGDADAQVRAEA